MKESLIGKEILIHSYKHNEKVHRSWSKGLVLEETNQYYIVINDRTLVTESDGRRWYTREPAIWFFPKNDWYNVICMIRKNGVYFYCNIASPVIYDGEALKYIDYDLDLKVFPDYKYKVLDEDEYELHRKLMDYSSDIDKILHEQLEDLIQMTYNMAGPFRPGFAQNWYAKYQDILQKGRY